MVDETLRTPVIWRRDIRDASAAQSTLLGSLTALLPAPPPSNDPPPTNYDWPNPRGRQPILQDWIAATNIVLGTAHLRAPYLWQRKPRVDASAAQTTQLGSNTIPLTPVVVDTPFTQTDWPNPRGVRRNRQDWSDTFKLPLQEVLPPRQTDWPIPRGPQPLVLDWQQAPPNPVTVPPEPPPISQSDWPNPRAARRNRQDWSNSFKLPLQQTLPLTQKNWPLPTPARKRGPQDWILPVNIALYTTVQIKPPNRQWDWPVPKGPRQPVITTRYYVQGFTPPVAPIYNPDLTLKNEVRRVRFLDNISGRIRYLKNEIRS